MNIGDVIKIKITGLMKPAYWYRDLIGEEFWAEVYNSDKLSLNGQEFEFKICRNSRGHYVYGSYVDRRDCEVLYRLVDAV